MIRVLLAEDQAMVRGALLALLALEDDIEVVADVETGDDVLPTALATQPDVAVLDIGMPGLDGLAAAVQLRDQAPTIRTLILTGLGEAGHVARALEAEVTGFLRKNAPSTELADAIRRVHRGQRFVDPALVSLALRAETSRLSDRERTVLDVASKGGSTRDIAAELHLSTSTVRNYLSSAFEKLGARNRIDAVRIARERGWL